MARLVVPIYAAPAYMGALMGLRGFWREMTRTWQSANWSAYLEEDAGDLEAGP